MKRNICILLAVTGVLLWQENALAQKQARVWDHDKAKAIVEDVLATEEKGIVWDKIKWSTDARKVIERSRSENKPIIVFWFISKGGPDTAPC